MTDLVVAALSGAGTTIVVAIVVAILAMEISTAKGQLADTRVADERKAGALRLVEQENATLRSRAELAEKRLRDADALFAEVARELPVDGAFGRLLRSYERARSLDGAGGSMPHRTPAGSAGSDDLLKPSDSD
jgi:hypothetical protein